MSQATVALVIAQPGPLRNSLMTLLSTLPKIEIVAEANDFSTLNRITEDWRPDLIVLEACTQENGLPEAIEQINRALTCTRAIVLVDTKEQHQQAISAGADAVLMKGFRADRLVEIIERLLSESISCKDVRRVDT